MASVRRFTQLRAWQACVRYKKAVYAISEVGPLATKLKKRTQLEDSVAGPPAHIAEGYGRFNPADFARFVVMARSSLMESQNHLLDLVALRNARRARERRIASRQERHSRRKNLEREPGSENPEE